jgi:hypothetical protein
VVQLARVTRVGTRHRALPVRPAFAAVWLMKPG